MTCSTVDPTGRVNVASLKFDYEQIKGRGLLAGDLDFINVVDLRFVDYADSVLGAYRPARQGDFQCVLGARLPSFSVQAPTWAGPSRTFSHVRALASPSTTSSRSSGRNRCVHSLTPVRGDRHPGRCDGRIGHRTHHRRDRTALRARRHDRQHGRVASIGALSSIWSSATGTMRY